MERRRALKFSKILSQRRSATASRPYYVEPFTTYDADIIFVAVEKGLTAGIPAIYAHLQKAGWRVERGHLLVKGFPVHSSPGRD